MTSQGLPPSHLAKDDKELADDIEEGGDDDDGDENDSVASAETVEPDCDRANSLKFCEICRRMEKLWQLRGTKRKRKVSDKEKKEFLLPPGMLKAMEPQSIFPLFRLILPDIDNSRNTGLKEKLVAQAYCDAESFGKGTRNYEMLFGFTDPQKVPHNMAGDLSLVVQHVLEQRLPPQPSKLTVGQMNALLDDLGSVAQRRRAAHNHEWRNKDNSKKKQKESITVLREQWLRKVMAKGLSPLEHKWLVRILLQKMEFGLGWRAVLSWYSKYALGLWNSHNSLKNLCDTLANPEYTRLRQAKEALVDGSSQQGNASRSRWEPQDQPASLGHTITPMFSSRVYFGDCLTKIHYNHKEYMKTATVPNCLALQFPTFVAEIKLDGERMIAHVQDGQVTMQTRNGKWYSQLYSPVLGPALRRALKRYHVNVILDGEVEAWDDGRKELVPFGNNRTVANARRGYMRRNGLLEAIDSNLHAPKPGAMPDPNVMGVGDDYRIVTSSNHYSGSDVADVGKDCWLQFLVFDILYLDGPDAEKLLQDCYMDPTYIKPGSIIHLTLLQRKQLLQRLLVEQPREIEICPAVVMRSNGGCILADEYFSTENLAQDCNMEHLCTGEHSVALLDSTQTAIQGSMPDNVAELDRLRRRGRSDLEIGHRRSKELDHFYKKVVEEHKMEGLVIKDLASPYIFGMESRGRKYWHKFKPDYEEGEKMDVVVLGAFFATGLRHSGRLSSFLCGCVDDDNPSMFMTVCNVNGRSIRYEQLDRIMELTGFKAASADGPMETGKWFTEDDHGTTLPSYLSHRSYQRRSEGDDDGWSFNRNKNYPDLFIQPEDSVVLELKGQEFVTSEEYSAGITLRFPRIKFVRHEALDGGEKSASEVSTHRDLYRHFFATLRQRQEYASAVDSSTAASSATGSQLAASASRFLTPEEFARKPRKRKGKSAASPSKVPKVEATESKALQGITFTVLEGKYSLDSESLEAQEAKEQGWLQVGLGVKRKEDIMKFILLHGGNVHVSAETNASFIIGGRENDARVVNHMKGIEYAKSQTTGKPKTKKALQLQKMAENEGVLKWTFVFSLVHRWQGTKPEDNHQTIKEGAEWMLVPKTHDYLAKSSTKGEANEELFDLKSPDTTKMELLRALEEFGEGTEPDLPPWQYTGVTTFNREDRWVLSCRKNAIWPFTEFGDRVPVHGIVLYPDVFHEDLGLEGNEEAIQELLSGVLSNRWLESNKTTNSAMFSTLPLAKAMGAIVTPHLHNGVTHILCDLVSGVDSISLVDVSRRVFRDEARGQVLLNRVAAFRKTDSVKCISPDWIRSSWGGNMAG